MKEKNKKICIECVKIIKEKSNIWIWNLRKGIKEYYHKECFKKKFYS